MYSRVCRGQVMDGKKLERRLFLDFRRRYQVPKRKESCWPLWQCPRQTTISSFHTSWRGWLLSRSILFDCLVIIFSHAWHARNITRPVSWLRDPNSHRPCKLQSTSLPFFHTPTTDPNAYLWLWWRGGIQPGRIHSLPVAEMKYRNFSDCAFCAQEPGTCF